MVTRGGVLNNRTVVVTRDESIDGPLSIKLKRRGANVLLWTTVRFSPPADLTPLRTALANLESYSWVVFTSARAVVAVVDVVEEIGGRARHRSVRPAAVRVVAVGTGTARALRSAGWPVDLEPDEASSDAVLRALDRNQIKGTRILFPASSLAGSILTDGLQKLGATVDGVIAYRAESVPLPTEAIARIQRMVTPEGAESPGGDAFDPTVESTGHDPFDAVCFASPSAVQAWSDVLGPDQFAQFSRHVLVAAIGTTTETALRGAGCENVAVAREGSFLALADAIAMQLRPRSDPQKETRP